MTRVRNTTHLQLPMTANLFPAEIDQKPIIGRLMQLYLDEISEYRRDEADHNGLYDLGPYFDLYWEERGRHPFLILDAGIVAGFALVREYDISCWELAEFFIQEEHRRRGIGAAAAHALFRRFKGTWQVAQHERNTKAQTFWRAVIDQFTRGDFQDSQSTQQPRGPMQKFVSSAD